MSAHSQELENAKEAQAGFILAQSNFIKAQSDFIIAQSSFMLASNISNVPGLPCADSFAIPRGELIDTGTQTNAHFTLFPKLPIELRFKIWKMARPKPKFIELCSAIQVFDVDREFEATVDTWHPQCIEKAPVLYFTCQEAREVVLKTYKPIRGDKIGSEVVFCDFSVDYMVITNPRLFFSWTDFLKEVLPEDIRRTIRRVAVDQSSFEDDLRDDGSNIKALRLEELVIEPNYFRPMNRRLDAIIGLEDVVDEMRVLETRQIYEKIFQKLGGETREWQPPVLRFGRFIDSRPYTDPPATNTHLLEQ